MERKGLIYEIKVIQYYKKALKYRQDDDFKNALKYINKMILMMNDDPEGYTVRAGIYAQMRDKEKCFADHDKAISLSDNSDVFKPSYLWINRASSYIHFGEYQKALDDCNVAIGLESDNKLLYRQRGHCYEELGKYDLALADFKRAGYQEGIDRLEEMC